MATPRKKSEDKLKVGRPSIYNAEIAKRICHVVATHTLGYRRLHAMYPDLPYEQTVREWRLDYPEFGLLYAQAKLLQAELLAEECLDIADDSRNDWMESLSDEEKGNGFKLNAEHINRARLRIDTRKFFASKLLPKKYGDLINQNLEEANKAVHEESMKRAEVLEKEY